MQSYLLNAYNMYNNTVIDGLLKGGANVMQECHQIAVFKIVEAGMDLKLTFLEKVHIRCSQ